MEECEKLKAELSDFEMFLCGCFLTFTIVYFASSLLVLSRYCILLEPFFMLIPFGK